MRRDGAVCAPCRTDLHGFSYFFGKEVRPACGGRLGRYVCRHTFICWNNKTHMEGIIMKRKDITTYRVTRHFEGTRSAREVVAALVRTHSR